MKKILSNPAGFTLVELLVAMGLGLTIMAAVATTFMSQTRVYSAQEYVNEMDQNVRGALDVITREVKMAGYKPNGGTVTGVTYSTTQLQIEADQDGNGTINNTSNTTLERIIYAYDSGNQQITRKLGSGGTAEILADNITSFTFNYYNADGNATTNSANIRQVKVTIAAQTAKSDPSYAQNNGHRTLQLTATITPPNLGY